MPILSCSWATIECHNEPEWHVFYRTPVAESFPLCTSHLVELKEAHPLPFGCHPIMGDCGMPGTYWIGDQCSLTFATASDQARLDS